MQKNTNKINLEEVSGNLLFSQAAEEILGDFSERSKEIVKKRFGISCNKPETLEKIGKDYGITRERVRQIIADAIKKIAKKKNNPLFKKAENQIVFTIDENFGIIKITELLEKLAQGNLKEANAIVFLHVCSDKILETEERGFIRKAWAVKKETVGRVKKVRQMAEEILEKESRTLKDKEISEKIFQAIGADFSQAEILSYLKVADGIDKNKFGKWGIVNWPEISPKGAREKIYLVLKEKNKPLHFTEIAKIMDEYELSKGKAHPQTVHNELIKNDKFVLIGRGTYALREWGYRDGTVKDVLEEILKKNKKPMTKEDILKEVSRIRKVKQATILINLSNHEFFSKENDFYFLKK